LRIECSSCGSVVKVYTNDNGEVNCPRCGAGLVVTAARDEEIKRYNNPLLTDDVAEPSPSRGRVVVIVFGAVVFAVFILIAVLRIFKP
jgi:predicted RNA-binding Zn-ribbon protein involved in translation (DUF1610 family)